jgi:hypothetical protein
MTLHRTYKVKQESLRRFQGIEINFKILLKNNKIICLTYKNNATKITNNKHLSFTIINMPKQVL